jgi:protein involved in polysaccharide export with SLBB domain
MQKNNILLQSKSPLLQFIGLLILLILLMAPQPIAIAQSMADIANIKVDDLSDEQLKELVRRANEAGITEVELIQMARVRGVPVSEIDKLKKRLEQLELEPLGARSSTSASKREPRRQADFTEISQGIFKYSPDQGANVISEGSSVFGLDLFYNKNRRLSFEPNLNLATPKSYVLGPGDMVYVDVYGQSEKYYEAIINPEGNAILDNIGPISLSGKTIEEATALLKNRLSTFYTGMRGANPNTFLQVSLGNVRTIKVHLVGELRLPGTFTLSAFSSVFNALYSAGGPNENGTLRKIKVIRQGKPIAQIDVYDFLINGKANLDLQLQDQDVILVDPFVAKVAVSGEVKRPKTFEITENETFQDILRYAGGFTDEAFRERVNVTRITGSERAVSDILTEQFPMFIAKGGDQYHIGKVLNRFSNRVQIKGAVFREGSFSLTEGLTVSKLIQQASGVRGDAYLNRASILRTFEDLSTEVIAVNLKEILNGQAADVQLQREDVLRVASIYDLQEEVYVQVSGEVKNPGTYPFSKGMNVEDLIVQAGGLRESASPTDIEIARRASEAGTGEFSSLIPVKINEDLSIGGASVTLQPYDNLIVRKKSNFSVTRMVQVEGQVNAPGIFQVRSAEERISDLIRRAGGLTAYAYPKGATLIRRTEFYQTETEQLKRQKNLLDLREKLIQDPNNSEAQELLLERLFRDLGNPLTEQPEGAAVVESRKEAIEGIAEQKSALGPIKIRQTEAVAIDLESIIKSPGSAFDLILEEGDIITIPRQLQTVRLRGDVVYPATVRYEKDRSMGYYISRAGGFDIRANRKRTYVVYANGEVARTRSFLGIKSYPPIAPGAEVIVPTKGPKLPIRPGELVGITTGLATLVLIISQLRPSSN